MFDASKYAEEFQAARAAIEEPNSWADPRDHFHDWAEDYRFSDEEWRAVWDAWVAG